MEDLIDRFVKLGVKLNVEDRDFSQDLKRIKECLEDVERAFAALETQVQETALIFQRSDVCPVIYDVQVKLNEFEDHLSDKDIIDTKYILYSVLTNITALCPANLHSKLVDSKVIKAIGDDLQEIHEEQKCLEHGDVSVYILY